MAVEVMNRTASDNRYLHRDFHSGFSVGLEYLAKEYGAGAVVDYLNTVATEFYAPLIERVKAGGFAAVRAEMEREYITEENAPDAISFEEKDGALIVNVAYCPAVRHMRETGAPVSVYFSLTTSAVWAKVCEKAGLSYAMLSYDEQTGAARHLFYKEGAK